MAASSNLPLRRAVFLDRDGVLNAAVVREGRPYPPEGAGDVEILPGVEDACRSLSENGFALIVVTNQPDVARGTTSEAVVAEINAALAQRLPLTEFAVCPHDDADGCACRKPKPGLILEAAQRHHIDLARSFTVGDRWRDVAAGRAAGTRTVFVDRGYDEQGPRDPDLVVRGLAEAVPWMLGASALGESTRGES